MRPSLPKYQQIWDMASVLKYFKGQGHNDTLSLKELSKKTVTLLTIATGHRIQTFSLIKTGYIINKNSNIEIKIPDAIKTTAPG